MLPEPYILLIPTFPDIYTPKAPNDSRKWFSFHNPTFPLVWKHYVPQVPMLLGISSSLVQLLRVLFPMSLQDIPRVLCLFLTFFEEFAKLSQSFPDIYDPRTSVSMTLESENHMLSCPFIHREVHFPSKPYDAKTCFQNPASKWLCIYSLKEWKHLCVLKDFQSFLLFKVF